MRRGFQHTTHMAVSTERFLGVAPEKTAHCRISFLCLTLICLSYYFFVPVRSLLPLLLLLASEPVECLYEGLGAGGKK